MEQIERIKTMEQHLNRASQAVIRLSAALDDYAEAREAIQELSAYYDSNDWKQDYADDEQGLLPNDLADAPLHFSRFFPRYKMQDLQPTPVQTLHAARQIAKEEGIRHVYLGNV